MVETTTAMEARALEVQGLRAMYLSNPLCKTRPNDQTNL